MSNLPPPCGRCGAAHCLSECKAVLHHGPGHQSRAHCYLSGEHEIHKAQHLATGEESTWTGMDGFTGFFDDPIYADD